jgi:hypothetical protein
MLDRNLMDSVAVMTSWQRFSLAAIASTAVWSVTVGFAWAGQVAHRGPLIARVADHLAETIRRDAHRDGSKTATVVKTRRGCCGLKTLTVFYRATPGEYSRFGAYELLVVTKHGATREVVVSEFPTLTEYVFGTKTDDVPTFELTISRRTVSPSERWNGSLSYDSNRCRYQPAPPSPPTQTVPSYCTGFGRGYLLVEHVKPAVLNLALDQALEVIEKARRHRPISTPDLAPLQALST